MGQKPDTFLGTEAVLLELHGLSIPTFRQAARLLQHEELLSSKRGIGGGYYSRKPDPGVVTRLAAIVMRSEGVTPFDVLESYGVLFNVAAQRAAGCRDQRLREELARHAIGSSDDPQIDNAAANFDWDVQVAHAVLAMCGNPSLRLLCRIVLEFGSVSGFRSLHSVASRRKHLDAAYIKLIDAILKGDREDSGRFATALTDMVNGWRKDDQKNSRR